MTTVDITNKTLLDNYPILGKDPVTINPIWSRYLIWGRFLDNITKTAIPDSTKHSIFDSVMSGTSNVGSVINDSSNTENVTQVDIKSEQSSSETSDTWSNKKDVTYNKMNANNTPVEGEYKGAYMGLMEKKDSPVSIRVGDRTIDKFFLTSVSYERKEKTQVLSMLDSSDMIYFFGDSPVMIQFAGICLDTYNFQWLRDMTELYVNEARGTISTARNTKIQIAYDDEIITGVIINMTSSKTAANINTGEIRFSMVITDRMSLSLTGRDTVTQVTANDMTTMADQVNTSMAERTLKNLFGIADSVSNNLNNVLLGVNILSSTAKKASIALLTPKMDNKEGQQNDDSNKKS